MLAVNYDIEIRLYFIILWVELYVGVETFNFETLSK